MGVDKPDVRLVVHVGLPAGAYGSVRRIRECLVGTACLSVTIESVARREKPRVFSRAALERLRGVASQQQKLQRACAKSSMGVGLAQYAQESGRAGRDGRAAKATLLFAASDAGFSQSERLLMLSFLAFVSRESLFLADFPHTLLWETISRDCSRTAVYTFELAREMVRTSNATRTLGAHNFRKSGHFLSKIESVDGW